MNRPNDQLGGGPFRGGSYPPRGGGDANRGGRFAGRPPFGGPFGGRSGGGIMGGLPGRGLAQGPSFHLPPPVPGVRGRMNHTASSMPPMMRGGGHGGRARGSIMMQNPSPAPHLGGGGRRAPMDNFRGGPGRPGPNNLHYHPAGLRAPGRVPLPPPPPPPNRFGARGMGNSFRAPPPPPPPPPPPSLHGGVFMRSAAAVPPPPPPPPPPPRNASIVSGPPPSVPSRRPAPVHLPAPLPQQQQQPTKPVYTKEQLDLAWTEHIAPEAGGIKYYHNSLSKESTYTMPQALLTRRRNHEATTTARSTLPSLPSSSSSPWKEYSDPTTGKTYYSNGVATQWTRPDDMPSKDDANTRDASANQEQQDGKPEPSKKRKRVEIQYDSKNEAIEGFKELLAAKDIAPNLKWGEVVKVLSSDGRWDAAQIHLSTGERKQTLAEYQTKRSNELRAIQRQERQRAKETFRQLLAEVLPSVSGFSAWNSNWMDMRKHLSNDTRFQLIDDESTRETLFVDFCEEFRKREDRRRRALKREAEENFLSFLKERRENGCIASTITWHSFQSSLDETERADKRIQLSDYIDEADQQHLFSDFIAEIRMDEEADKRRSHEARRKTEKEQRDNFHDVLVRLAKAGKLVPSSLWRDSQNLMSQDPSYDPLLQKDPQAPRDLFQRFVDDWNNVYLHDRITLSKVVSYLPNKAGFVNDETTYDEFVDALVGASGSSKGLNSLIQRIVNEKSPVSSAKLYFDELKNRAKIAASARRGSSRRRDEESSEDEGEIVEEGDDSDAKD